MRTYIKHLGKLAILLVMSFAGGVSCQTSKEQYSPDTISPQEIRKYLNLQRGGVLLGKTDRTRGIENHRKRFGITES